MSDKKKTIIVVTGCVLILAMVIVALVVPSAEMPKTAKTGQTAQEQDDMSAEGEPVTYDMLVDMPQGYVFDQDSIVQTAMAHYVDGLNGLYKENGSKETAECMTLKEAFSYAGVSEKVYEVIMQYHGKEYQNNPDIQRVRENDVAYDKDRTYYLITSKKDTNLYYVGETKNKRPQGCGAIFEDVDGNLTLKFAGSFDDGSKKGKGISFSSYGPILFIEEIAKYDEGHEKGNVRRYNVVEKENITNSYKALEQVIDSYEDTSALFAFIYNNFKTSDVEAVILKWLVRNPYTIYLDQPVIKCSIGFIGKMKDGVNKRGRLYNAFGNLVYKGNLDKAGIIDNQIQYPVYTQKAYYERYSKNLIEIRKQNEQVIDEYVEETDEPETDESALEMVSANDIPYLELPQQWRGEDYDSDIPYEIPDDYMNINVNPFRPYIPSTPAYQTPAQIPSQSYEPPEPEADDTGTTVIDIGLE